MKKQKNLAEELPKGWTRKEIDELIAYYDNQSEEEGATEIEAGGKEDEAMMAVPWKLVPRVQKLIAGSRKRRPKPHRSKSRRAA